MRQSRTARMVRILLIILFVAQTPFPIGASGINQKTYDGAVHFPAQIIEFNRGCLWIDGTLTSGNFFKGLKRINHDGAAEYTNNGKPLTNYPAFVTASIRFLDDQCASPQSDSRFSFSKENIQSLTFQILWKSETDLRPAPLASDGIRCRTSSNGTAAPASPSCEIMVKSDGVPLSDHLVVAVFGIDGNRLVRLSAAP